MNIGDVNVRERTIESIKEAVAYEFGLSVEELKQESSRREVVVPRQIAIYLAKQMTDASLPEIGQHFCRHHTSVMHSIARIDAQRRADVGLDRMLSELLTTLTQH